MKLRALLVLILMLVAGHVFALQCSDRIVSVGDSEFFLKTFCGEPVYTHVVAGANKNGDEQYLYYKINNEVVEIHMIDGHIYTIGN